MQSDIRVLEIPLSDFDYKLIIGLVNSDIVTREALTTAGDICITGLRSYGRRLWNIRLEQAFVNTEKINNGENRSSIV